MSNLSTIFANYEKLGEVIATDIGEQLPDCDVNFVKRKKGVCTDPGISIVRKNETSGPFFSLLPFFFDELPQKSIVNSIALSYVLMYENKSNESQEKEAEKLYSVTLEERLAKTITVSALNEREAEQKARALYKEEQIVLSGDDIQECLMEIRCEDGTYCSDWLTL